MEQRQITTYLIGVVLCARAYARNRDFIYGITMFNRFNSEKGIKNDLKGKED